MRDMCAYSTQSLYASTSVAGGENGGKEGTLSGNGHKVGGRGAGKEFENGN